MQAPTSPLERTLRLFDYLDPTFTSELLLIQQPPEGQRIEDRQRQR